MRKNIKIFKILVVFIMLGFIVKSGLTQENPANPEIFFYNKQERNLGFRFYSNINREELRSGDLYSFEELTTGSAKFEFANRFWNYLDYKQEQFQFIFDAGPLWGNGNWIDSSAVENIKADHTIFGLRTNANISYSTRYYWDRKNYTIIDVSGWGRYDIYTQNSKGTLIDSNQVPSIYDVSENQKKLRYGFQAKAGWGFGRLNPMNHFMVADFLLKKYYPGRNFSETEIIQVSDEIAKIKQSRNLKTGHLIGKEAEDLLKFISGNLLLSLPDNLEEYWQFGEFLPRLNGSRAEIGPFFQYYNQEPDFIYGGYFKYENSKYSSFKWDRNFYAGISYNGYKQKDWVLAELDFGWSYFPNLKNQFDFGLKYIAGTQVNGFENIDPISHNFVPYFGYYTQLNTKMRVKMDLALRIPDGEKFVLPGPEFSLAVYRSKY